MSFFWFPFLHETHTIKKDANGGSTQFDEEMGPSSFLNIYHDVFRILFHPSPGLKAVIEERLQSVASLSLSSSSSSSRLSSLNQRHQQHHVTQLIPGKYSVAHYRAEYGREVNRHPKLREPEFIQNIALNSLRCAIELQPGDPIYFASDNVIAMDAVRQVAAHTGYPIVLFDREEAIVLRLDDYGADDNHNNKNENTTDAVAAATTKKQYQPSDYYSTFVDLYLAGNGNCVAFGRGGFGRFANLLSYNASCVFKHVKQFYPVKCKGYPPLDKTIKDLAKEGLRFVSTIDVKKDDAVLQTE
jgi:hypothetical protein